MTLAVAQCHAIVEGHDASVLSSVRQCQRRLTPTFEQLAAKTPQPPNV
jgi:hypothetical protein